MFTILDPLMLVGRTNYEGPFTPPREKIHDLAMFFHSLYYYCLEKGFIRLGGLFVWGGTYHFEKQRWSLWDLGGGPFLLSTRNQNPGFLFATRGREEPKHQQQHEYTMGGHTCRNIADLACFNHWRLGDRSIQRQGTWLRCSVQERTRGHPGATRKASPTFLTKKLRYPTL